jgi:uncharacterized protein YlxW (UPF0749 family)
VNRPRPPDERSLVSARLLAELVNNALDPGYAAAARRRGADAPRRAGDRSAVAIGCLLVGFLLVVAYVHTHRSAPQAATVHSGLVDRVRAAQNQADALDRQARRLEQQLTTLRDRALPSGGTVARTLQRDQLAAGEIAARGPGMTVTLREPKKQQGAGASAGRGGTTSIGATHILTDRDVRSVVDELWRDGAEAIGVNGIRLTPTSAIRFAGQAVLVDYQPIDSPYEISAIGNPDLLSTNFAESAVASRYQTLAGAEGVGFSFTEHDKLTLPASAAPRLRYAKAKGPSR